MVYKPNKTDKTISCKISFLISSVYSLEVSDVWTTQLKAATVSDFGVYQWRYSVLKPKQI